MGASADEVWVAVLQSLRARGLEFEDVHLGDADDVEAILRDVFPDAPLYRALAATTWHRLSRILSPDPHPPPQQPLQQQRLQSPPSLSAWPSAPQPAPPLQPLQQYCSVPAAAAAGAAQLSAAAAVARSQSAAPPGASTDVWSLFVSALAARGLRFDDVIHASVADRWTLLGEVFPRHAIWRAQVNAVWASQAAGDAAAPRRAGSASAAPDPYAAAPIPAADSFSQFASSQHCGVTPQWLPQQCAQMPPQQYAPPPPQQYAPPPQQQYAPPQPQQYAQQLQQYAPQPQQYSAPQQQYAPPQQQYPAPQQQQYAQYQQPAWPTAAGYYPHNDFGSR